ncbi:unnamed protein product [Rhizophagus irregularis]|nr:unnamed protein product [Rhizophagus irregularis]
MDINNTFKITTINVAGLNTSLKQEQVLNFMKINKINILGVTETKLKNSIVENLYQNEKEYTSWWTCDDDNYYSAGVGIIMEKAYAKHVQTKDLFKGRLIHLTMFMKGKIRLSIILVYNYANNTQKPEILELYDKINEIIKSERKFQSRIIILGDFNINYEEFLEKQRKNLSIPWKLNLFKILNNYRFKDTNTLFHTKPLSTWRRNNAASRIDFNWVNFELIPDLIYASTNKVHIFNTDHSAVTSYFSIDDIFKKPQMATNRRHKVEKIIDYSKITDDQWKTFTEQSELILEEELKTLKIEECPTTTTLNRVWNSIKQIINKAKGHLPTKKPHPNKENLPEAVFFYKKKLRQLSLISMKLTNKKIKDLTNPDSTYNFIKQYYDAIMELMQRLQIQRKPLLEMNIKEFKDLIIDLFKITQIKYVEEDDLYKEEQIKYYVDKRCEELQDNKKYMLDSILNRKRKKIILDKVLIEKNGQKQLCTTDKEITEAMIEHYRNVAGKKVNDGITMNDRWQWQYAPKDDIDKDWYNAIVKEITEEEWKDTIQELAKDKAAGPLKVSNEELKHLGVNMTALTLNSQFARNGKKLLMVSGIS